MLTRDNVTDIISVDVGDIYKYIVGYIHRYILGYIYIYMVGYLQIGGSTESCYQDQRLFFHENTNLLLPFPSYFINLLNVLLSMLRLYSCAWSGNKF